MSVAASSLGERIASELENGAMQYTLIAGAQGISVTIRISTQLLLTVGVKKDGSIEEALRYLQEKGIPNLMKTLNLVDSLQLPGPSQK